MMNILAKHVCLNSPLSPDIWIIKQQCQFPLVRLDCLRMSTEQIAPVAHQEMGKVATLSGDKHFAVKANRVIKSSQPRRVALHQKILILQRLS